MKYTWTFDVGTTPDTVANLASLTPAQWQTGVKARVRINAVNVRVCVGLETFNASTQPNLLVNIVHDIGMCDPSQLFVAGATGTSTVTVMVDPF